jgi:transcriptional regulator with AAA-type ATPase domain
VRFCGSCFWFEAVCEWKHDRKSTDEECIDHPSAFQGFELDNYVSPLDDQLSQQLFDREIATLEKRLVLYALYAENFSQKNAAKRLGISARRMWGFCQKFNITHKGWRRFVDSSSFQEDGEKSDT